VGELLYNFEQLRMFVEVVDTGSFSACARKIGKVQSAVSQGIANLEIDLNINLFDRSTRVPKLTADGERLLTYARSVLQQVHEMNAVAKGINQAEEAAIRIALDDALLVPNLSEILRAFGKVFRATPIKIISAASPDIPNMLKEGNADIGLMFLTVQIDKDLLQNYIGNLPFVAVCSPKSELAQFSEVSMQDLTPFRQIMLCGQGGGDLDLMSQFSTEVWWGTSFYAIKELVAQNLGWGYLPRSLVESTIKSNELIQLRLSFDHKPWCPMAEFVIAKEKPIGPALNWLIKALKKVLVS
jgi:DNA-binding transcriptional LysR family regulator